MDVVLIDGDILANNHLERILATFSLVEIVGKFTHELEVIVQIEALNPDVVFLEKDIPEIDGLFLVKFISERLPHTLFVFVTTHKQYAVEAFELNTIDYLIKPVQLNRSSETIERLSQYI